jgi:hypothetical protein
VCDSAVIAFFSPFSPHALSADKGEKWHLLTATERKEKKGGTNFIFFISLSAAIKKGGVLR